MIMFRPGTSALCSGRTGLPRRFDRLPSIAPNYEEVLIARVYPEILRSEAIPDTPPWHDRYRSIVDLQEKNFYVNGTRIIKFYLHLSKEEKTVQGGGILERIQPRSLASFERHALSERMRHDQDVGKQDRGVEPENAGSAQKIVFQFGNAGMPEAEHLASLGVDPDITCLMAPSFPPHPSPEKSAGLYGDWTRNEAAFAN